MQIEKNYLNLLKKNLWFQNFLLDHKTELASYKGLLIPNLKILWNIAQVNTDQKIILSEDFGTFIAQLGKIKKKGKSPEEAMTKMAIHTFNNPSFQSSI